jgi:hypothetical protein
MLLCVGAWGWSYPFREHVDYKRNGGRQDWVFEIGGGAVFVGRNWGGWQGGAEDTPGWHYEHLGKDPWAGELDTGGLRLLGFQFFTSPAPPAGLGSFIKVPFWFASTLLAIALLLVWRKTDKPSPKSRGFNSCNA